MREKIISKKGLIDLIEKMDDKVFSIWSDPKWAYPEQGDTQGTCIMLDMNFNIEKRPGIVIYIPNKTFEDY